MTARADRPSRSHAAYQSLRDDIFAFRLLPGDRFTENDVAERLGISRTPVREALLRLQGDGLVRGYYRNGWEVVPLDLARFEALYELRTMLETHAVMRLCGGGASDDAAVAKLVAELGAIWRVPVAERLDDGQRVAELDEAFHLSIVHAAGNPEAAAVHQQVTDRIRIIRRLDFAFGTRIALTYDEHGAILAALDARDGARAVALLSAHIEDGRAEVSRLTTERLEQARTSLVRPEGANAPARRRRFG
ncbi:MULTISPECIES: GntR family transcriptional regulator [Cupriavidus]|uniref:GntR family transcriptional regulator n=1 Tax=Cupriavidus pauculus TaxID=82633 RepID=A0A5P2H287_9BURK|nr:GntR family transcriptional regulator [Cupriavidus pauculus]QET01966.1 GntR family transcriptional regulator [Cupriavidus pauculus]